MNSGNPIPIKSKKKARFSDTEIVCYNPSTEYKFRIFIWTFSNKYNLKCFEFQMSYREYDFKAQRKIITLDL